MARVPAPERTRNESKGMFAGKGPADRSRLVRQAARPIVEGALGAEAADALGRGYYERGSSGRGYRLGRVKTAEGEIEFGVPRLTDTAEPIRGRTEELERLAMEMYARGLSVRATSRRHSRMTWGAAC